MSSVMLLPVAEPVVDCAALRSAVVASGLPLGRIARRCSTTRAVVQQWLDGVLVPAGWQVRMVSVVTGVAPGTLFADPDEPETVEQMGRLIPFPMDRVRRP